MQYLFLIGFISILSQVCLLRELNAAFFGIELIYILSFGIWLFGTALGSSAGRREFIPQNGLIQTTLILTGAVIIADTIFIRSIRVLFGVVTSAYLSFDKQIFSLLIILLPVSFLSGLLFQWAAKKYIHEGGNLPRAYAVESAGGIAGGLFSSFAVLVGIQNFTVVVLSAMSVFLITCGNSIFIYRKYARSILPIILLAASVIILLNHQAIDLWSSRWNHPAAVFSNDTPYGRITVSSAENQYSIFENDELVYESESTKPEFFVFMSLVHNPHAKKILLLGGGYAGLLKELTKIKDIQIDYVEINEKLITLIKETTSKHIILDDAVNIIFDDPRTFLLDQKKYDMILIGAPDPNSILNNRFYTKEFFELCRSNLNRGGILSFIVSSSENLWTPQLRLRNSSIYKALSAVFKSVIVLPGEINLFVASEKELNDDTDSLSANLEWLGVQTKFVNKYLINYSFTNDRFFEIQTLLNQSNAAANTDLKPVCFQHTVSIWLSKFFPEIAFSGIPVPGKTVWAAIAASIAVLFAVLFLLRKKFIIVRKTVLVFCIGFIGMVLEIVIIINYQINSGVLFQNIGLLITMFMIGLAGGSFVIDKIMRISADRDFKVNKYMEIFLLLGIMILSAGYYLIIVNSIHAGLIISGIFLMMSGFLTAGIFAYAATAGVADQKKMVAPLYAADVAGGAAAAVAVVLFIVPAFGISGVVLIAFALSALQLCVI